MIANFIRSVLSPLLRQTKPTRAKVAPDNPNRVHLFYGSFASELEATDYCITPLGRNKPEPLTRDLPDATIDTTEVEIIFGASRIAAAVPMFSPNNGLIGQIGAHNTVVIIAEAAFFGLPYTLNDTPVLTYAGAFDVS